MNGQDEDADGEALAAEPLKPLSEELKEEVKARAPAPRRAGIKKEDFKDHGYTPNCPGCTSIVLKRHYHQGHSEECRRRMEECLKDDERMKAARQR